MGQSHGFHGATARDTQRYEVLQFIERSIGRGFAGFSSAANAAELEALARRLTAQRWGPEPWARGHATHVELGLVLAELSVAARRDDEDDRAARRRPAPGT